MKNFKYVLIIFVLLFSLNINSQTNNVIQQVINKVNIDSLLYFVKELSGVVQTTIGGQPYTIVSRYKNNASNDKAGEYIKQKFESYGLQASFQSFSTTGKNVIGIKTGTKYPNRKYIICAHFDDMPSGSTAPGADDNASGTSAVIESARIFSQFSNDYTIVFAAWDEEEQGLVGSNYYATQAQAGGDSIMGVINLDMIAFDNNNDMKCEVHTKPIANSLTLSNKMVEFNQTYNIGLNTVTKNPGLTASDHASFWNKNYSAILLIEDYSGDFNLYYHTVNDKIQYYNIPYYEKTTKLALATFAYFTLDLTIPVELISFSGKYENKKVKLNWITATETNNKGFEIHKSEIKCQPSVVNLPYEKFNDNSEWVKVGFVIGKGTTTEKQIYSFEDNLVSRGKNLYRLKQIDFDGSFEYSNEIEVDLTSPNEFNLEQNYPNPFNPKTKIKYHIANREFVTVKVFDILGNEVTSLVNELKESGSYEVELSIHSINHLAKFITHNLPSGVYFYKLTAGAFSETKKMILMK